MRHFGDHSRGTDFGGDRFHSDYSHESRWSDFGNGRSPVRPNNFKAYSPQDFHNHFVGRGYTEKEILNNRCLYMFDDFVKFAQTYSSYSSTIKEIHIALKSLTLRQRAAGIFEGTYCANLQKRIHYLYNELSTLKNEAPTSTMPVMRDLSLETFVTQIPEYEALKDTYQAYTPLLSQAIEKRLDVYDEINQSGYYLTYTIKAYDLNNNVKQLLSQYGHDTARFTQCYGNPAHQVVHRESIDLLEHIHNLPHNSVLYDHQEALVDFAVAMVDYNHECMTDKAMMIGDFCWTLLDYGQAIAEGAVLGAYSAVHDMVNNPLNTALCIFAGKEMLAFQLSKVLCNVADIGLTALVNPNSAKEKWNKYAEPLNNIIDAINKKEITLRDGLKGGTALFVGWKAQGKLLGGLGKFCNTIQQKSINFVKNSPLLKPAEYLTTPEGLLFKATAQSNKFQQTASASSTENLKNTVEKLNGTIWKNIKPTDPMYPGTKIPKSFELTVGKQKFWVCPNSTEHMLEYIVGKFPKQHKKIITHNMPVNCQALLLGFKSAVKQAISGGVKYDTMIKVDCWEFRFGMPRKEGLLPTIYHANFKPQNW